ncbi:helicase-related protein [Dichotomicrobium thermohalophilum]|uniref:Helicase-like protein n=1 Tax=Dichotomicrobium thermohalophilum TaxID=933063 RepID=A0A397PER4_9HYPH|nr:helicase-related protein [Dichotomicrobium thermohalophilum]RIA47492.1 helicase-like protein [Dichotomicrobium thermohalophilum]
MSDKVGSGGSRVTSAGAQTVFVDHRDGNNLLAALRGSLPATESERGGLEDAAGQRTSEISIATAYFSPAGFAAIADRLEQASRVRLMIGAEAPPEAVTPERLPGDPPPDKFEKAQVRHGLRDLVMGLRRERDKLPFRPSTAAQLKKLSRLLRSGRVETRRYERSFLHAKAYLFEGWPSGFFAGSSNLTRAGLTKNMELNLGHWDPELFQKAKSWFDELWDDAVPFDLAAFYEEVDAPFDPYTIFLRVLWQLFGDELDREFEDEGDIPLTAFQRHGVWRANRILKDFGGVIVADEVGLGKTFIAGEIINAFAKRRQRVLLVCPAVLRDTTWKGFLHDFQISRAVECVSFDELGRDVQFSDPRRPHATQRKLSQNIDDYALVVVDEAHNYRNPDAPYRADVLRRLLFGPRKDVVLLTATPVNNSLWDLYHLTRFFVRQDSALADRGIVSIRQRFKEASRVDPSSLNPDFLFPIIDAVTVKRTRAFVKKHYVGESIKGRDGSLQPIVFPKPEAISVRYNLDALLPGFFDMVADALDPANGTNLLRFARYALGSYLLEEDEEAAADGAMAVGLLRSGLLKRFESSAYAFHRSLERMIEEHERFLEALQNGKVVRTAFLQELSASDDLSFEELLQQSNDVEDAAPYDTERLYADVQADLHILRSLAHETSKVTPENDPKIAALIEQLETIAEEAERQGTPELSANDLRKVLIFSFFRDTVHWIYEGLQAAIKEQPRLAPYRDRIVTVVGQGHDQSVSREEAVMKFAPKSAGQSGQEEADLYDLLVATDVMAEGMNLQQCRHIINYDMPWNPMRLVQRHGRIDRIGSPHKRVFLRTIFPADRLDDLLNLEQRILDKLAQAARSIGVETAPLQQAESGRQVFSETRSEIERLAQEDPTLFEIGGTEAAAQTGEEYRQQLREELKHRRERIVQLPFKAGSGLFKGQISGVFFLAQVEMRDPDEGVKDRRTFTRFVPTASDGTWTPDAQRMISEVGTCLRLIECGPDAERYIPKELDEAIYDFWETAEQDIYSEWQRLSDPANLQPSIRPLNKRVAEFIRTNRPVDMSNEKLTLALDILEAPWPRREEMMLRNLYNSVVGSPTEQAEELIEWVLGSGLEPFNAPTPLPRIDKDNIELICWLAVASDSSQSSTRDAPN